MDLPVCVTLYRDQFLVLPTVAYRDDEEVLRAFCRMNQFDEEFWFRYELCLALGDFTDILNRLPFDGDLLYFVYDSNRDLSKVFERRIFTVVPTKRIDSYVGSRNEVVVVPDGYQLPLVSDNFVIVQIPDTYSDEQLSSFTEQLTQAGVNFLIVREDIKFLTLTPVEEKDEFTS